MPFDVENTSSGKLQEPAGAVKASGARTIAKILPNGEPGSAKGFRPGGGNGYNVVGGKSGMQVRIPGVRDVSKVR
jgi:hypothetical protein